MDTNKPSAAHSKFDVPTVIAIAAIAYVLEAALHEHVGHAMACIGLGGKLRELNAFYIDCDYKNMNDLGVRLVALAGPTLSLITGSVAFFFFYLIGEATKPLRIFLWLLGSVGLMTAAGYPAFSGFTGAGDFGTEKGAALYGLTPEWLWRSFITLLGIVAYWLVVRVGLGALEQLIGGSPEQRLNQAKKLSLTSYLAGGLISVLIGLFKSFGRDDGVDVCRRSEPGWNFWFGLGLELFGPQKTNIATTVEH